MIGPSPVYAYSIAQQMRFVKGFLEKSLRFFEKVFGEGAARRSVSDRNSLTTPEV